MKKHWLTNWSKHPKRIGILVFVILALISGFITYIRLATLRHNRHNEILEEALSAENRLHVSLSHSLSAAKTLAFIIHNYGITNDFENIGREILQSNGSIDAIQFTRKGVIKDVYPIKGNESVIGYDILKDPENRVEALKAIQKRELFFAGPIHLKQGGDGIVGRLPVFIQDTFFGFAAVVLKMQTLVKAAQLDNNSKYYFQFSKINPNTGVLEYFLNENVDLNRSQEVSLPVSEGEWELHVIPKDNGIPLAVFTIFNLGLLISALFGWIAKYLAEQPEKLKLLIMERTRMLLTTENNYKSTLERVSDAFVSLDRDWRFTFMNKKAGEILNRDPEEMIGKHIWTEYPEAVGQPFFIQYYKAMETQKYVYLEEYFTPYTIWLENHIYPAKDGLTIYFRDVSERKMNEQKILAERNFSQSIIDSLPGVFYLYDRNGKFRRWNNNFETISGYSAEEVAQMHPLDFFYGEEKELLREKIALVFEAGTAEVESEFITKSGEKIPYYFNGYKINLDGEDYLMGVGIDIAKRKNAEQKLKESEQELRRLSAYLQNIREAERTNIAREIHDVLGQQLTGLKMDAVWLSKKLDTGETDKHQRLDEMIHLIDETVKNIRRIASDLRPGILDDMGLVAALEWQSSEFQKRTEIPCTFHSELQDIVLDRDTATGIFRIYQETLTNVMRHAKATRVDAELFKDGNTLSLRIKDNGVGFDSEEVRAKRSLGLLGMEERALMFQGQLKIESHAGEGTTVLLELPV